MVWICRSCGYTLEREGYTEICPSCGQASMRKDGADEQCQAPTDQSSD